MTVAECVLVVGLLACAASVRWVVAQGAPALPGAKAARGPAEAREPRTGWRRFRQSLPAA